MNLPPPLLPPSAVPSHRDRRTGLIVFGIFAIVIGLFFALSVPMTLLGQFALAQQAKQPFELTFTLPTMVMMATLATALIWLGVGSIQARRWARALLLCGSVMALCIGLLSLMLLPTLLEGIEDAIRQQPQGTAISPAIATVTKITMILASLMIYVVIPGAFVLFYRSPHVRRTCELRDPVERWTDRCPLPVLAMCVLQAFGAGSILFAPGFGGAFPIGSFVLTGWSSRLLWLGFSVVSIWVARGFYRRDRRVWNIYVGTIIAFIAVYGWSFRTLGLEGYYRAVGLPEWQIAQVTQSPMLQSGVFVWIGILATIPFIGYLIYLRQFFVGPKDPPAPA